MFENDRIKRFKMNTKIVHASFDTRTPGKVLKYLNNCVQHLR
jgi:hypothetical protein